FHDFAAAGDSVVAVDVLLCDLLSITGPGHLYRLRFHSSATAQATPIHIRRLLFYNAGETVVPVHTEDAQILIGLHAGVGDGGPVAGALRVEPNPATGRVQFVSRNVRPGWVEADILDLQGRLVRRLGPLWLAPGARFGWDGTDASGGKAAPGVYEARIL